MKPNQQQIEEACKVYDLFWEGYQKGDIGSFATTLDDHFEMIGTSETERCHSKAEGIEFFKGQTEEVVGKAEMRNRQIQAIPVEGMVLVNELCDIYVLTENDWNLYSKIRISTFLRETADGWKVVQQHGSFPDMRVQEGETLAIDKISRENVELRDAVKRRTAELEQKSRDLEIEAALERVRSVSMAMHESDELVKVATTVYQQLIGLGFDSVVSGGFNFPDVENNVTQCWFAETADESLLQDFRIPLAGDPVLDERHEYREKGMPFLEQVLKREEVEKHMEFVFPKEESSDEELAARKAMPDPTIFSIQFLNEGYMILISVAPLSEEQKLILGRFSSAFNSAYTRFLDLQKAEEQTREAEIEASLERVRAKGLSMHSTGDIKSATAIVFNELTRLGIGMERCGITLMNDTPIAELWSTTLSKETKEVIDIVTGFLDFRIHPLTKQSYRDWQEEKEFSTYHLVGDELQKYYDKLEKQPGYRFPKVDNYPEQQVLHSFFFNDGALFVYTILELSADAKKIVRRFTNVFEQTYTRFLDLQKAEKQAREAQIEAALERVRSRSMAMQKSGDLRSVVDTLYGEFESLEVDFHVAVIQLIQDDSKDLYLWLSTADGMYDDLVHWPFTDIPVFHTMHKSWSGNKTLEHTMGEAESRQFFEEYFKLDKVPEERREVTRNVKTIDISGTYQKHTGIFLMRYTDGSFSAIEKEIVRRFSKAFEQTYTRFLDLQKAEKLAFESARQASLDRIRAEIASMRSAEDLQQITPIIWDELKKMGIPFIRCGVFIIDEEKELSHTYLSTAQGDPIAALHLPLEGIPLIKNLKESWDNSEIYTIHWNENDFREWTQNLIDKGFIDSKKKYEAGSAPKKLDLHFLPFKHGMLYIGNTEPLSSESLDLGQSMAKALSVAYDRYEDFNKLEQAKTKVENALSSLEAAQEQLVQQEKLASLGQLTAGIAHEIKNPLNFINNFSDLSVDLVNEIREELSFANEGNELRQEDINDILNDLEANLKTIYKHGTRTDTIVKSMLEHSRGGSGVMEPNNVNELLQEFGNLSYHGMRAGKEPMQVEMVYELDDKIEDIPIVAEDFSRVIVNLCYNSFDAMRSKEKTMKENGEEFDPKLILRTRLLGNNISIEIEDNGAGIPEEIKDKILQPFFTTKKGTAGTGLGLSITNEIISAHSGSLQIDSEKDTFTRFSIVLPQA